MATNPAFTGSVFDLSREPSGIRVAVTCSDCKTRQVGGDKADCPIDIVSRHFSAKHWLITDKWRRATCPECQRKRGASTKSAPDPVDMSKVQADLDRQREAEEKRKAVAAKTAAEVFAAPAPAPAPAPTPALSIDEALPLGPVAAMQALVNRVPIHHHGRDWWSHVPIVVEMVDLYLKSSPDDRSAIIAGVRDGSRFEQSIGRFVRGKSSGGRPWSELVAGLKARGITPLTVLPLRTRNVHATPTTVAFEADSTMTKETKTEPSREARRAHAAAIRLLDLHFTIADGAEVGRYAEGWTDERVAKESGLSPAEVSRTREDVYGRLEDPQEVARAAAITDLSTRFNATMASLRRDMDDARRIVDALAKEVDERTAAFQREVAALKVGGVTK